jgi:hypothetical protein
MLMKLPSVICVLISLLTIPTFAQDTLSWIGKKVVTKYDYPVTIGGRPVDERGLFHVWTVQRTKGVWLWVVSGPLAGSIPASRVVLLDRALRFYTRELSAHPENFGAWGERGIIWLGGLAAAYAEVGEFVKATEWQEKTTKLYTGAEDKKKGEERLKLYLQEKPYRQTD